MKTKASDSEKEDPIDLASLKQKSVRGGTIKVFTQGTSVCIQMVSAVILARLLAPEDYGILAMVAAVTTFAGLFRDFGLSTAAVQKKHLSASEQSNLFWINIALGALLTLILIIISPAVAWFYESSEIVWVTVALAFTFLINSIGTQSGITLTREMRFGSHAIATVGGAITALVVAVTLAMLGYRYWALAWGQIANSIATTTLFFIVSPFRPGLPSRGTDLKQMLGFGANVAGFNFINYFARNLDNILIGRFCGSATLGLYSRAYTLLMMPVTQICYPISEIAFPAMSKIQDQPDAYAAYYRRIVSLLAHASMPLTALLFINSKEIIELLLGEKWLGAAPIFSILAITAFVQSPYSLVGLVQLTLGRGKKYFKMGTATTVCVATGFCIGVQWGAIGVATAYAIVTYLILVPFTAWAFHDTPLHIKDFFGSIWLPMCGSLLGIGAVTLITSFGFLHNSIWVTLILNSLVFGMVHMIFLLMFQSGRSQILWVISTGKETWRAKASNSSRPADLPIENTT